MIKFQNQKKVVRILFILSIGLVLVGCSHVPPSGNTDTTLNQGLRQGENASQGVSDGRFVKGQKAPIFVLETFDGQSLDLATAYGTKAVVLDFWAAWCPFCVAEMPELQKAQRQYGDDLLMIGVHRTDTEAVSTGQRFAQERGVTYPLVKDSDGSLYRASGGLGMPVAVFIDKDGIVREVKSGPKTAEEIGEKVGALVN